ncbi:MAG: transposase [Ilumatobacteraceae bacterium]
MVVAKTSAVRVGKTGGDETPTSSKRTRSQRRVFTHEYKLSILAEHARCSEPGERPALLRREGIYSSTLSDWRRQDREGLLVVKEGRTADGGRGAATRVEMQQLRAENERLRRRLEKAETIIEVQGKVQALLGELSKSADTDEPSS